MTYTAETVAFFLNRPASTVTPELIERFVQARSRARVPIIDVVALARAAAQRRVVDQAELRRSLTSITRVCTRVRRRLGHRAGRRPTSDGGGSDDGGDGSSDADVATPLRAVAA
jgi:hypothetical protein